MNDLVYAWRNALKSPAFSLLIIVTLALGIGTNAAVYSVAYRVLLAPLPFTDGERLVTLEQRAKSTGNLPWQPITLEDFRSQTTAFEELLGYVQLEYSLLGEGTPYFANVGIVTDDYFGKLGIQPALGRGFAPEDEVIGARPVMLLGYELWQTKFGGDEEVIGRSLELESTLYTVIGVLPSLPAWPRANDVWITWASDRYLGDPNFLSSRGDISSGIIWTVIGKLRRGVSRDEAQHEVDTFANALKERWPEVIREDYEVKLHDLRAEMRGDRGVLFALLYGLSLLVLVVSVSNVASLRMVQVAARSKELAVREALGASPGKLLRQLISESLLYAAAGGVLGAAIAWPASWLLSEFAEAHTSLASGIRLTEVLMPMLGVALVTGICSGFVVAAGRRDISRMLKEDGDRVTTSSSGVRKRRTLLVLQLALSFVMLTSSALILLGLKRLYSQYPGYEVERVWTANFQLNSSYPDELQGIEFGNRLLTQIGAAPEVQSVAIAGAPLLRTPLYGQFPMLTEVAGIRVAGSAFSTTVTEAYFSTLNIPLLKGRGFAVSDDHSAEAVVIVNANFEITHFPEGALGQRVSFTDGATWRTIIGVVGNVRPTGLDREEGPAVYVPFRQLPTSLLYLVVKSSAESTNLSELVTSAIHNIDPRIAVEEVSSLEDLRTRWLAPRALLANLLAGIGVVALLISGSGVVGVVAHSVNQSMREIGVRASVGATPRNLLGLFMRQGLRSHVWGLLLGLALMLGLAAVMEPLLYQTSAFEAWAYLGSALLLSLTVFLATYVPALRASRVDPAIALHHE